MSIVFEYAPALASEQRSSDGPSRESCKVAKSKTNSS